MKDKQLSGRKLKWFRAIAIAMPLIILIIVELFLRAFDYGHDTSLFIRYPDNPDYWVINKYASERYFSDSLNSTKGSIEPFRVEKQSNTYRIFVLGESTTAGYPYMHNGSFHRWLKFRLMHTYPNLNFEIINLSLTAVNSYTVLDFGKEVANYQPDAVLIYVGHNEYYGALGVGSTSRIANNRFVVKTVLGLRKLRLVQLIDNILYKFKTTATGTTTDTRENLMERMAASQKIAYQSPEYFAGIRQFQDNMNELFQAMQDKKIPVFLSTVVSNEKDLAPFISSPGKMGTANQQYQLANQSYIAGNYSLAKLQYDKARVLDLLRFRAPDAINESIIKLTQKYKDVHLVGAESLFEQYSPHQILGKETILEHVHPNLYGYAILSDAFYQSIQKTGLIKEHPVKVMSFNELLAQMPVTKVDSLYGVYTIMMLETGWPFNKPIPAGFNRGTGEEEQLAGALSVNNISWLDAINGLFQYSMKAGDKKTALKAVEAVMLEYPQNTTYQVYAGKLSFDLGDFDNAVFYFKKLYDEDTSAKNAENMYLVLLKTDQPEKSVKYIEAAMQGSSHDLTALNNMVSEIIQLKNKLQSSPGSSNLREQIAMDYHKIGADEAAKKYK